MGSSHHPDNPNFLALTLSLSPPPQPPSPSPSPHPPPPPPPQPLQPFQFYQLQAPTSSPPPALLPAPPQSPVVNRPAGPARPATKKSNASPAPRDEGKSLTVPAPFPWATTSRATIHTFDHLLAAGVTEITGLVQCKSCERRYEMAYNLRERFQAVGSYILGHRAEMDHRAPAGWVNPVLPTCRFCGQENSADPVWSPNSVKKREINWLFLFLGELLGRLKLEHLKYFCKYSRNHRTGSKNRVLYLVYLGLCKQLDPDGPFDHR